MLRTISFFHMVRHATFFFLITRVRTYCYGYQVLLITRFWRSVIPCVEHILTPPDLWFKLILLEIFSQNTWPFLSTDPVHINPGGHPLLQLASTLGVALWGHMPWDLQWPMLISCHPLKCVLTPWSPALCFSLGWVLCAFPVWGGTGGTVFVYAPHWGPQSWLASCKVKIIASHTSLPLVHLPRLPWKWTCCFWSTHVL